MLSYDFKRVVDKIHRREGFTDFIKASYYEMRKRYYLPIVKRSWSADGEDIIIDNLLGNKKSGFYVDVGAFLPKLGNHTMRFYQKGWAGINIEPNKDAFEILEDARKRDVNLNLGVSDKGGSLIYYKMFPYALSTFSEKQYKENINNNFKLLEKQKIRVETLEKIFKSTLKTKK